jgi:hypothetical protein
MTPPTITTITTPRPISIQGMSLRSRGVTLVSRLLPSLSSWSARRTGRVWKRDVRRNVPIGKKWKPLALLQREQFGGGLLGTYSLFHDFPLDHVGAAREESMKLLLTALTIIAASAISPASAQKAGCTSENMAKLVTSSNSMPETPGKMAMMKEVGQRMPLCQRATCGALARATCA